MSFDKVMKGQQEVLQEGLKITTEIVTESFSKSLEAIEKAIIDQQSALQSKFPETSKLVEELKNLTHIKEGVKDFKVATDWQNMKIEELTKEIRTLAEVYTSGGIIKQEISFPKWLKTLAIAGSSLLAVTCLFYIVPILVKLISKLVKLLI
ncbi:MAG: hypothetical protein WD431_21595 [Cyclobacteriaceae bacterium]